MGQGSSFKDEHVKKVIKSCVTTHGMKSSGPKHESRVFVENIFYLSEGTQAV